jgi:hypothetical protein
VTRAAAPSRRAPSYQLREFIEASGLTAYALGRKAGVDPGVVQRFITGERDIRMETADRLCEALGLRLVEDARRKRPGAGRSARDAARPLWGDEGSGTGSGDASTAEGPAGRPESPDSPSFPIGKVADLIAPDGGPDPIP